MLPARDSGLWRFAHESKKVRVASEMRGVAVVVVVVVVVVSVVVVIVSVV